MLLLLFEVACIIDVTVFVIDGSVSIVIRVVILGISLAHAIIGNPVIVVRIALLVIVGIIVLRLL